MANTLNLGNGNWATKKDSLLAYNSENGNFKPLPFSFERASSATVVNKAGLIETVGSGEPRIDFSNDAKGALLLEPSRTNLITYSEDFSQWNLINTGDGQAPILTSGYTTHLGLNASRIIFSRTTTSTSNTSSIRGNDYTQSTNTFSIYIKSNTSNVNIDFRLGSSIVSYEITNEWKRMEFNGSDFYRSYFGFIGNDSDLYADLSIVAAQAEAGSYPTSYIPTQGSIGTRVAETGVDCLLPNESIIDNSTATVYFEFEALADDASNRWISFEEVGIATDNQFEIRLAAGFGLIQIVTRSSGGGQDVTMSETLTDITANNKIALNYNGLNWKLAVNGNVTDTATAARLFNDNIGKIKFSRYANTNHFYGKVKDLKVYNTALTDQELINLTKI